MKNIIKSLSYLSLIIMTILAALVLAGKLAIESNKVYLLILSIIWFVTAPMWILEKHEEH